MGTNDSPSTAAACEYAELMELPEKFPRDVTDVDAGAGMVIDYLRRRVDAVLDTYPQTPVVMLSGGIDSILVAAVVSEIRPDAAAATFAYECSGPGSSVEMESAREVAGLLGMEHIAISPSAKESIGLMRETALRVGKADMWEVLAGMVVALADKTTRERGLDGALFTGGGADVLLLGGVEQDVTQEEFDTGVLAGIKKDFAYAQPVPDFYERLLDEDPDRYILTWQTQDAVDVTGRLALESVRGTAGAGQVDKLVARRAAMWMGLPERVTAPKKSPLQISSNGVRLSGDAARAWLDSTGEHSAYSSPLLDDDQTTIARLFFELLIRDA